MYRTVAFLAVAVVCASAVPVQLSESDALTRERRFAPGQMQLPVGNQSPQGMAEMVRRMTGQNLDQVLSNVMGRPVNVQELLTQAGNDTAGGDPWTKVAERLFGKQAVADAMAQVEQMRTMMSNPNGRAQMMQRMEQMMQSAGMSGMPSGSLASVFNSGSIPNVFNAPGTGGVRMPSQPSSGGRPH